MSKLSKVNPSYSPFAYGPQQDAFNSLLDSALSSFNNSVANNTENVALTTPGFFDFEPVSGLAYTSGQLAPTPMSSLANPFSLNHTVPSLMSTAQPVSMPTISMLDSKPTVFSPSQINSVVGPLSPPGTVFSPMPASVNPFTMELSPLYSPISLEDQARTAYDAYKSFDPLARARQMSYTADFNMNNKTPPSIWGIPTPPRPAVHTLEEVDQILEQELGKMHLSYDDMEQMAFDPNRTSTPNPHVGRDEKGKSLSSFNLSPKANVKSTDSVRSPSSKVNSNKSALHSNPSYMSTVQVAFPSAVPYGPQPVDAYKGYPTTTAIPYTPNQLNSNRMGLPTGFRPGSLVSPHALNAKSMSTTSTPNIDRNSYSIPSLVHPSELDSWQTYKQSFTRNIQSPPKVGIKTFSTFSPKPNSINPLTQQSSFLFSPVAIEDAIAEQYGSYKQGFQKNEAQNWSKNALSSKMYSSKPAAEAQKSLSKGLKGAGSFLGLMGPPAPSKSNSKGQKTGAGEKIGPQDSMFSDPLGRSADSFSSGKDAGGKSKGDSGGLGGGLFGGNNKGNSKGDSGGNSKGSSGSSSGLGFGGGLFGSPSPSKSNGKSK